MKLRPLVIAASLFCLTASHAYAEDLVFSLTNNSSADLVEFYASPTDVEVWEEDILDVDILESGESVEITIADGRRQCDYHLRMVFDDDDVIEGEADLCQAEGFTIN